jgi:hypothetical protein
MSLQVASSDGGGGGGRRAESERKKKIVAERLVVSSHCTNSDHALALDMRYAIQMYKSQHTQVAIHSKHSPKSCVALNIAMEIAF